MLKKPNVVIAILSIILVFLIAAYLINHQNILAAFSNRAFPEGSGNGNYRVVIDPGHGGHDPGKVAGSGMAEKDINLEIALKLKKFLEAQDVSVIMIRESDKGLYAEGSSNKKVEDMKGRLDIIENSGADLAVSIHQNSYQQESVHGAQVFYYTFSDPGKKLAEIIQEQLILGVDPQNHREAKANGSYYLLKKTSVPIAIVECGFLSNAAEAEKLADGYYQEKLAWAIQMGVLRYLNDNQDK